MNSIKQPKHYMLEGLGIEVKDVIFEYLGYLIGDENEKSK